MGGWGGGGGCHLLLLSCVFVKNIYWSTMRKTLLHPICEYMNINNVKNSSSYSFTVKLFIIC